MHICMCAMCPQRSEGGIKFPGTGVQFVSCHMRARTKPRSPAKAASAINTKPYLQPAPKLIIF